MTNSTREPASGWMEKGAHVFPLRVYYEDTDASGVVYHAAYLEFMERGRSEYLRAAGVLHQELTSGAEPLMWTVRRIVVEYLKSARLDDSLIVRTRLLEIGGARVRLGQEIRRGSESLITGDVEACLVSAGKPRRIPEDIRARMEKLST
jgi:acyl-CoA thioester hydrolase